LGCGVADVLVTDGFTGNVVLKTAEGSLARDTPHGPLRDDRRPRQQASRRRPSPTARSSKGSRRP
jgi:hypothetical protein